MTLYLTPNKRLALFLEEQQGIQALSFQAWTEQLWSEVTSKGNSGVNVALNSELNSALNFEMSSELNSDVKYEHRRSLLSLVEQWILWENIIQEDSEDYPLLKQSETAIWVCEAWHVCKQWKIPLEKVTQGIRRDNPQDKPQDIHKEVPLGLFQEWTGEEHHTFLRWANTYEKRCQENNWVDTACFLDKLTAILLNQRKILLEITCVGFSEWTPQQHQFLEALKKVGANLHFTSLLTKKGEIFEYAASSESEELSAAVHMAQQWLNNTPDARIGILMPNLSQRRFEVQQKCNERSLKNNVNIAAPLSGADYPMIQAAFLALKLGKREIKIKDLSMLLRLPFYGHYEAEMNFRAQLEILFRDKIDQMRVLGDTLPLSLVTEWLEALQAKLPDSTLHMVQMLKKCLSLQSLFSKQQKAQTWKENINQLLNAIAWPGERSFSTEELQLQHYWRDLLEHYCAMDRVLGKHTFNDAVHHLKRLAAAHPFLPLRKREDGSTIGMTSIHAPIQILGLLEGLGLPFDYVWVMGLNQEVWPNAPNPNPFIPLPLQKSLQCPRSSSVREFSIAKEISQQLMMGGKTVVFSYATTMNQHDMHLSPLFGKLKSLPKEFSKKLKDSRDTAIVLSSRSRITPNTQCGNITSTPPIPVNDNEEIRGGSTILKLQARCPFRAFAEIRLKAKALTPLHFGLSPAARGEILHQVLHSFWRGLKSQTQLKTLSSLQRKERIKQSIDTTFDAKFRNFGPNSDMFYSNNDFVSEYLTLERQRLLTLMERFIELELKRPPFEVIAHEVMHQVDLNGLLLNIRIDRIDRLENNEELLIDYKTGKIQISEWFGERPMDPQLPLYCIARKPTPEGVAFAIIRSDEVNYQGISTLDNPAFDWLPSRKMQRVGGEESWEAQCSVWEYTLKNLAGEFKAGRVDVAPLENEKTCRGCHYKSLCRVFEESYT